MTYSFSATQNNGRIVSSSDGVTGENVSYTARYVRARWPFRGTWKEPRVENRICTPAMGSPVVWVTTTPSIAAGCAARPHAVAALLREPGDHRETTPGIHRAHGEVATAQRDLFGITWHRSDPSSTVVIHVRFPLALPCFHRVTGSGAARGSTWEAPEERR